MSDESDRPDRATREILLRPTSTTQEVARAPDRPAPRSGHAGARLVVLAGPDAGRKLPLQERTVIGRAPGLAATLSDGLVSRTHARITREPDGRYTLEDLGSRHGTFVHGARISRASIAYGDRIELGGTTLLLSHRDPEEDRLLEREQLEILGRLGAGLVHDMNLLLNARDATPRTGRVTVTLGPERSTEGGTPRVVLTIRDTGPGMTEEIRARIFEPLFTTKPGGTGLGLSTVARVIEEHGGRIACESTPGVGTAFAITLPESVAARASTLRTTKPPAADRSRR